ncbi:MAG: right-handed parallel beta-helix repeat-containing protein [Saccharofermentanales bacterium]
MESLKLFISTTGHDSNDGSESTPFFTIERARDEVRRLKKAVSNQDIDIIIRGGLYTLDHTVVFGVEDSGSDQQKIRYIAHPGEEPIFSSGKSIRGWEKADEKVEGLHPDAKGNVWIADAKASGITGKFFSLFRGETKLPRARSKGFAPVNDCTGWYGTPEEHTTILYPEEAPFRQWDNMEDIDIILRSVAVWQMCYIPLAAVDAEMHRAKLNGHSLYRISKMMYWLDKSQSVWIENALDFIDEPGKWAYNSRSGLIYYWPLAERPEDNLVVPMLRELFKLEGSLDRPGCNDIPVENIEFEGLTFIHGERDTWPENYRGYEMQHAWNLFDHDNAMLRLRGAAGCSIRSCRFRASSSGGIRLDLFAKRNSVTGCTFENLGGSAIVLGGYGPGTKDVNTGNLIHNNLIRRIGEAYWHSPAIFVWQSSCNRITNNRIDRVPYTGIVVSGRIVFTKGISECSKTIRWDEIAGNPASYEEQIPYLHSRDNLIVRNEITNAVEVMGDGDAIYNSGSGRGNVIRQNYIHDCTSIHFCDAIRCDDNQVDTVIDSNIIHAPGGLATGICSKGKNTITNNIIYMTADKPNRGFLSFELGPVTGSVVQNNILYATKQSQEAYFMDRTYGDGEIPVFAGTFTDRNIFFNENVLGWGKAIIEKSASQNTDQQSMEADPGFYDIANKDFRMHYDSPAFKLGFKTINVADIGLVEE